MTKRTISMLTALAAVGFLSAAPRLPTSPIAVSATQRFAPYGELDCNGYSLIQRPVAPRLPCADLSNDDNEHYIGHDEPEVQFYSNVPGSGFDVQWTVKLPTDRPVPATQTFQNETAFWLGMVLCDPQSHPLNNCRPDSDGNPSGPTNPKAAGSAFLEMQFYPPGMPPAPIDLSCDMVHWCASMAIFSLECNANYSFCNRNCEEPTNFAFIQLNGVPTGPPGPASATIKTFTPNAQTLLMSQGDVLRITIKDTPAGLLNVVGDVTSGQSGFMVASTANGFQHLDLKTCRPTAFAFHPEFATAKESNDLPWSIGIRNIAYASEVGHFEKRDGDKEDKPCYNGPVVAGCYGSDVDFEGDSYVTDWPDGTANSATSIQISSSTGNGIGPQTAVGGQYRAGFSSMRFVTGVPASEKTCRTSIKGCMVPPPGAAFYPLYVLDNFGSGCVLTLGNRIKGATIQDFGGESQWGKYDVPVPGTFQGKEFTNPCIPH
jgi:hypothetical protein